MLPRRSAGCTGTNLFTYYLALAEWGVKMHRNDIRISISLATIEFKERKEGVLGQALNIERRDSHVLAACSVQFSEEYRRSRHRSARTKGATDWEWKLGLASVC